MKKRLAHFMRDEDGATLVEYGIALILAITVGGTILGVLATTTEGQFRAANSQMTETSEAE